MKFEFFKFIYWSSEDFVLTRPIGILSVCCPVSLTITATRVYRLSCKLQSTNLQRQSDVHVRSFNFPLVSNSRPFRWTFPPLRASSEVYFSHYYWKLWYRQQPFTWKPTNKKPRTTTGVSVWVSITSCCYQRWKSYQRSYMFMWLTK